jgi:hypothetical protein
MRLHLSVPKTSPGLIRWQNRPTSETMLALLWLLLAQPISWAVTLRPRPSVGAIEQFDAKTRSRARDRAQKNRAGSLALSSALPMIGKPRTRLPWRTEFDSIVPAFDSASFTSARSPSRNERPGDRGLGRSTCRRGLPWGRSAPGRRASRHGRPLSLRRRPRCNSSSRGAEPAR